MKCTCYQSPIFLWMPTPPYTNNPITTNANYIIIGNHHATSLETPNVECCENVNHHTNISVQLPPLM